MAQDFLDLIKKSRLGKFKIYIGMIAGVGKTYRMLQETRSLLVSGIDVKIGYIETHGRQETEELLQGLPLIPRKKIFYKGKEIEEMDVDAIINLRPEVVIIDELAHSNIEGSKNEKRWQDVLDILSTGINVISAINIQHIESLNEDVMGITGIDVKERVPDFFISQADEVVNLDLTADELVERLKAGKIYSTSKIESALKNFFKSENILQLRELALKEVASQVERKVESEVKPLSGRECFLACISSNEKVARNVIRKTSRLANYYNSKWYVLYVQTPKEDGNKISLSKQRHLIDNFKLAIEMGAELVKSKGTNIAKEIIEKANDRNITTICIGKPHLNLWEILFSSNVLNELIKKLSSKNIDVVILS